VKCLNAIVRIYGLVVGFGLIPEILIKMIELGLDGCLFIIDDYNSILSVNTCSQINSNIYFDKLLEALTKLRDIIHVELDGVVEGNAELHLRLHPIFNKPLCTSSRSSNSEPPTRYS